MMPQATTKEDILARCRELVSESGAGSLNMREVARRCGVASGSIYNYFPSKEALLSAVTESVWADIFRAPHPVGGSFTDYLRLLYYSASQGAQRYPGFFATHSVSFAASDRRDARLVMESSLGRIEGELLSALDGDEKVSPTAFGEDFSRQDLADLCISGIIGLLARRAPSCRQLCELVRRAIY
jgi:AcrR family transcriptional regulator